MKKLSTLFLTLITGLCFSQATITVTEINYNSDSTKNSADWFEIYNYGSSTVDLSLFRLRDSSATGLYLVQPGVTIAPGGYLVFCSDTQAFDAIYNITNRIGNLGYNLGNGGDGVRIFDNTNAPIQEIFYLDSVPWPKGADGFGRTLELINTSMDPTLSTSWRTGCVLGSPGTGYTPCVNETIVVSEINYKSSTAQNAGDWFEIRNIGSTSVNIGNYGVRNHKTSLHYLIPSGTILAPQASLVVYNTPALFNAQFPLLPNKVGPFLFGLDGDGDAIRLYNSTDKIIFSVYYDDDAPWPNEPDGFGYTLEADTNFIFSRDVNNSISWFAGCPEGSPGEKYTPDCVNSLEEYNNPAVSVYPNPASEFIQVSFLTNPSEWNIGIYNILGEKVMVINNQTMTNVGNLSTGTYILEIVTPTFRTFKKLMISHE
jgi:hypothetical protein